MTQTIPARSAAICRPRQACQRDTSPTPAQLAVRALGAANAPNPRLAGRAVLLRGDAAALPLPDESVDLVVTSPPYWAQRSYTDGGDHYDGQIGDEPSPEEYIDNLVACTTEWARVLKPGGSIFVNLGDKYAARANAGPSRPMSGRSDRAECRPPHPRVTAWAPDKSLLGLPWRYALRCIGAGTALADPSLVKLLLADVATGVLPLAVAEDLVDHLARTPAGGPGLTLRAEILWAKTNGMPESVEDRVRRTHEQVFHLTKSPRYYSAIDSIREQHSPGTIARARPGRADAGARAGCYPAGVPDQTIRTERMVHPAGALPGSVWKIPTRPLVLPAHVAHTRCCAGVPRPDCTDGIGHYAAFPMDLPRRIITGWCPPSICTACEQPRALVPTRWALDGDRPQARRALQLAEEHGLADEHLEALRAVGTSDTGRAAATQSGTGRNSDRVSELAAVAKAALGGYVREFLLRRPAEFGERCACPDTSAPTRPAVVLDPFGGTGTTALVAAALGRTGISVDRSADYTDIIARWRTNDPTQIARALGVPTPQAAPPASQGDLFAGMLS